VDAHSFSLIINVLSTFYSLPCIFGSNSYSNRCNGVAISQCAVARGQTPVPVTNYRWSGPHDRPLVTRVVSSRSGDAPWTPN
jgi:hypothetical protein